MEKLRFERPVITRINAGVPDKFGRGANIQSISTIDDIEVSELIANYGSPLFVISEKKIRATYQEAVSAFKTRYPKIQFAWSYKTNYLNAVCKVYHQEDHGPR
jgi:diaminopimelate decarboxylase